MSVDSTTCEADMSVTLLVHILGHDSLSDSSWFVSDSSCAYWCVSDSSWCVSDSRRLHMLRHAGEANLNVLCDMLR